MRRIILFLMLTSCAFGAWDNDKPADSDAWNDAAGYIRANNDALEAILGVDLIYRPMSNYIINVKETTYGAVGDGSTDDTTAIQAAIDAANTAGAWVYFPPGTYKVTSTLTYNPIETDEVVSDSYTNVVVSHIGLFGNGVRSKIEMSTADTDLFDIGSADRGTFGFYMGNLWLANKAGTGSCIYMQKVSRSFFENITIPVCGKAGIEMSYCIGNTFKDIVISSNAGRSTIAGATGIGTYGVFMEPFATLTGACNGNTFVGCIIEGADTTNFHIGDHDMSGGSNTIIGGVIEGTADYNVYADEVVGFRMVGVHCESASVADVYLDSCGGCDIDLVNGDVTEFINCYGCTISGNCLKVLIDADCDSCKVATTMYNTNQEVKNRSDSTIIETLGLINQTAYTARNVVSRDMPLLVNCGLEDWNSGNTLPEQFANYNSVTCAREGTTFKQGTYSAKLTKVDDNEHEQLFFNIPTQYKGQWISVEAWMKPNEAATQPYIGKKDNGGNIVGKTSYAQFSTPTTDWQKMTGSFYYETDDTSFDILIGHAYANDTSAILFVDSVKIWAEYNAEPAFSSLDDTGTPSVANTGLRHSYWLSGGTTTITDIDDGYTGQMITIIAEHSVTLTDGTHIFLDSSANAALAATDTITLVCKADNKWYEVCRGNNA